MIGIWGDYSQGIPGGAALKRAGFTGVIRYVGIGSAGKRMTVAERDDLLANGLQVLGVVESTATEADNGYAAGVADGKAALADPASDSLPYLLFTNDQPTFTQADVDYARGFASAVGSRTGGYGFYDYLTACGPLAAIRWQCGHPPNLTGTQGQTHLWQRQGTAGDGSDGPPTPTTVVADGVQVDISNQLLPIGGINMAELDDVYDQLTGSAVDGQYPGWSDRRYNPIPGAPTAFTLLDYVREVDREVNSRLDVTTRSAPSARPSLDTLFGHVANTRAELADLAKQVAAIQGALSTEEAALLAAIKAVPAAVVDPTALATALEATGLPGGVVSALLAVLNKAAQPTPTA